MAIDIYGVAYGIKNADGILPGGSDMVNVSKDLSPEPPYYKPLLRWLKEWWFWGQVGKNRDVVSQVFW